MKNLAIAPKTSSRLVFVDTAIDDFYNLVLGVIPDTEIVVLHPSEDGISQITLALKEYTQVSSLHIVSHGTPGWLKLGNTVLSLDSLSQSANQLRQWRQALSADANLLLYGCNVAAGETGRAFVERIKQLVGAEIAASSTLIGSAERGGNWQLDVTTGEISTPLAFSPEVIAAM